MGHVKTLKHPLQVLMPNFNPNRPSSFLNPAAQTDRLTELQYILADILIVGQHLMYRIDGTHGLCVCVCVVMLSAFRVLLLPQSHAL